MAGQSLTLLVLFFRKRELDRLLREVALFDDAVHFPSDAVYFRLKTANPCEGVLEDEREQGSLA